MRQYRPGDKITIDIQLEDESGIETVQMTFREDENALIEMAYRGPVTYEPVTLEYEVTEQTPPGLYKLSAFVATDSLKNRADYELKSNWDFEIVNHPVDTTGPTLISVNVR